MGVPKWKFFFYWESANSPFSKAWRIRYWLLINRMPVVFPLIQVINTKCYLRLFKLWTIFYAHTSIVMTKFYYSDFKRLKVRERYTCTFYWLFAGCRYELAWFLDIRLLTACLFDLLRVENKAFASFVGRTIFSKLHWVGNGGYGVTLVPPRAMRYQHSSNYA